RPLKDQVSREAQAETEKKIEELRKSIIQTLTPWIPGDFVVTYGILITAWTSIESSFMWLLIIAAASALTYVVLGAFSVTGFKESDPAQARTLKNRLMMRTVAGFVVSVYAAVAIPGSGWHQFAVFRDNELAWLTTATVVVVVPVMLLKGLQKRLGISLEGE
ncbi:MAG TPA: hypothetical protein VEU29_00130, partial [Actinomycetota bacterium]|nr:hypothetical protein [Actinomycetota bacterium]